MTCCFNSTHRGQFPFRTQLLFLFLKVYFSSNTSVPYFKCMPLFFVMEYFFFSSFSFLYLLIKNIEYEYIFTLCLKTWPVQWTSGWENRSQWICKKDPALIKGTYCQCVMRCYQINAVIFSTWWWWSQWFRPWSPWWWLWWCWRSSNTKNKCTKMHAW